MASGSLLFTLTRKWRIHYNNNYNREIRYVFASDKGFGSRFFSSSGDVAVQEEVNSKNESGDELKDRIFRLKLPKRSATNIVEKWVAEGNCVTASELRNIAKELGRSQRYKHALEISEWMHNRGDFELSDSDYANRIDLITKVFGIDAVERYFEGLPLTAKSSEVYTALLHSFARAKQFERAEELYVRMKEMNLSFTALMYNEMMTMYMSIGQLAKVPLVIEELKRKNVGPDIFTYNLWISSSAAALDIDQVQMILNEMSTDSGSDDGWARYINITKLYISAGHLVSSGSSAVVEAEKGITQREWITYDFLLILYAGLGNKDKIDQIWMSLRLTKQKMTNRNFVCILSCYLMLSCFEEAGEVIDQWRQSSTTTEFDLSACKRLLDALSGTGFTEIANRFHMLLIQRDCDPTKTSDRAIILI